MWNWLFDSEFNFSNLDGAYTGCFSAVCFGTDIESFL